MVKKLLYGMVALVFCTNAFAWCCDFPQNFEPGFYLGIYGGWGKADAGSGLRNALTFLYNTDSVVSFAKKDIDEGGWANGGGYLGYSFTPYIAVEIGGTYFNPNRYRGNGGAPIPFSFNLRQRTFEGDLVGRLTLPLGKLDPILTKWSVYGRAGAAYVSTEFSGSMMIADINQANTNTREKIRPIFGLGVVYDITANISADAFWKTIISNDRLSADEVLSGQYHTPVPNCNIIGVGLFYKFINII